MERRSLDAMPKVEERTSQAITACMRGHATPQQAAHAMAFVLNDLCGIAAVEPAFLDPSEAGFARGKRWVGITLARLGKLTLWTPEETDD